MADQLHDERCRECDKEIRVAKTLPHEGDEEPTGCGASVWDDDQERHVGWICLDCAWEFAMRTDGDDLPHGMLSFPDVEFTYCWS